MILFDVMFFVHFITTSTLMKIEKENNFLTKAIVDNNFVNHIHKILHQANNKLMITQN